MKSLLIAGTVAGLLAAAPGYALLISPAPQNAVQGIFDGSSGTRTVTVAPGDLGGALDRVKDVNITIEFMKCPEATNALGLPLPATCPNVPDSPLSFAGEIRSLLKNPSLPFPITLVDSGTYDDSAPGLRVTVTFDDEAANAVGGAPATGAFQPVGLLSTFDKLGAVGTWELTVEDLVGGDPLGYARFSLAIDVCSARDTDPNCVQATGTPVPATALLLGLGFAGLAAARRRRH